MKNNLSFCIVTFGDDLITKTLQMESRESKVKLAHHFTQYFDIQSDFRKLNQNAHQLKTISEMLGYLNLKDKESMNDTLCQSECKSMVRLINSLCRGGFQFIYPVMPHF